MAGVYIYIYKYELSSGLGEKNEEKRGKEKRGKKKREKGREKVKGEMEML